MKTTATVRWTRNGYHQWVGAPDHRHYLGAMHRHRFYFEAEIETFHDDREVEFHDLLAICEQESPPDNESWGGYSCEMMARDIARALRRRFLAMRSIRVSVFEDNECGATLYLNPGEDV